MSNGKPSISLFAPDSYPMSSLDTEYYTLSYDMFVLLNIQYGHRPVWQLYANSFRNTYLSK